MKPRSIVSIILVIAAVVLGYFKNAESDKIVKFNDTVVDIGNEYNTSFEPVIETFNSYLSGETISMENFHERLSELRMSMEEINAKLSLVKIPDSNECRDFHASMSKYIGNGANVLAIYHEVVPFMEEHNPLAEEEHDLVFGRFKEVLSADDILSDEMIAAQKVMAKKHNMRLQ